MNPEEISVYRNLLGDTLTPQIKNRAHERQGAALTNFATTTPSPHLAGFD